MGKSEPTPEPAGEPTAEPKGEDSALADWTAIQAMFPAYRAISSKNWAYAISNRMHGTRLTKLREGRWATALSELLKRRGDARLKALRTFAAINHEQAVAAFRLTLVVNVSVPVLILTLLNQAFPGAVGRFSTESLDAGQLAFWLQLNILLTALVFLLVILIYSVCALNQARDIRHLIDLFAAERGIFFGLEDTGDMQSG